MRKVALILVLFGLAALTGCRQKPQEERTMHPPMESSRQEDPIENVTHEAPKAPGVYRIDGEKLIAIEAGNPSKLLATNADHGFGFGLPAGAQVTGSVQDWSIHTEVLNTDMVQITYYKGIAAPTPYAFDEVSDSNTAWLAAKNIDITIKRHAGFIDIHTDEPLEPGFYVIHDDSLNRAARRSEVTAYYPFIVSSKANASVWETRANTCFDTLLGARDAENEKPIAPAALTECVYHHRLALKLAKTDDERKKLEMRLIYLAHKIAPEDETVSQKMAQFGNMHANGIESELWQGMQEMQFKRLIEVYQDYKEKKPHNPELIKAVHGFYSPDEARVQQEDFETLAWAAFSRLRAEDESSQALFQSLVNHDENIGMMLAEILGAIGYRDLTEAVQQYGNLALFHKKSGKDLPASFRKRAGSMILDREMPHTSIGPMIFNNVPNNEISAWRATLSGLAPKLEPCARDVHEATFILSLALNGSASDPVPRGTLRDPFDTRRKVPAISPEAVSCILKVFGEVPMTPAIERTQNVQVSLTFR